MTRPLHVLQMTAPARFGGLEEVVLNLSEGLRDLGHRVTVFAPAANRAGHPFGIALKERRLDAVFSQGRFASQLRQVRRFVRENQVDVLHSHGYRSDVLTALAARLGPARTISTVHGFTGGDLKNRGYEWLQLAALKRFDAVVAVSSPLRRLLLRSGIGESRLHLVPNACVAVAGSVSQAEARDRLGLPRAGPVIGWVGRLGREKGPELAIEALEKLSRNDWVAAFVGDGPDRRELERLAGRLGIGPRVRWLGPVPRAGELLAAFDVLLLSSRTEGTPVVLLEAMAAQVPIVATSVGGVPDLLDEGACGRLVPPGNPSAMAGAIGEVLERGPTVRERTVAALARLRSEYDPEVWIGRYVAVYRQPRSE